jgi:hypothetical protein
MKNGEKVSKNSRKQSVLPVYNLSVENLLSHSGPEYILRRAYGKFGAVFSWSKFLEFSSFSCR